MKSNFPRSHERSLGYRLPSSHHLSREIIREILLLFFVLFLPGMLVAGEAVDIRLFDQAGFHLNYAIITIPQILLVLYIIRIQPHLWPPEFGLRLPRARDLLHAAVIVIMLYVTFGVLLLGASVLELAGFDLTPPAGGGFRLTRAAMLPLVAITSLLTGYREELFFRAYMLPRLRQAGVKFPTAVAVSTALFAIGHLYQGVLGVVFAAMIGVVMAIAFRLRPSVHPIGLAHAAYNLLTLVFTLIADRA